MMTTDVSFRARARTLDMLGRQQIAGIPTAISELFKNAHDADAERVEVDYYRSDSLFVLRDDGFGMETQEFVDPPATSWKEQVPAGSLNESATLRPPPQPLVPQDLSREALPGAWQDERTNGLALTQALSQQRSAALPWGPGARRNRGGGQRPLASSPWTNLPRHSRRAASALDRFALCCFLHE